jgi:hypothetical protein
MSPGVHFEGLRCCSPECERKLREREKIAATMAAVGMTATTRRKCEQCGGHIPHYQSAGKARRETRRDARFCSKDAPKRPDEPDSPLEPLCSRSRLRNPHEMGHPEEPRNEDPNHTR